MLTLYVYLIFIYEVFGNILTEFARRAMSSPGYNLSHLERKLWKDNSFFISDDKNGVIYYVWKEN